MEKEPMCSRCGEQAAPKGSLRRFWFKGEEICFKCWRELHGIPRDGSPESIQQRKLRKGEKDVSN